MIKQWNLVGRGVKLIGEDEFVTKDGQRLQAGSVNRASERFTNGFTRKYPDLAAKTPVYAQLRNLIDMTVAAHVPYTKKASWKKQIGT